MGIKTSFREMNLGPLYDSLAAYAKAPAVEQRLNQLFSLYIVSLGQGGGRVGAELAKFGWDIKMVNSASVDMEEHKWISTKNKVMLEDPERGKLQGTAKNARIGYEIAQKNVNQFKKIGIDSQDSDLAIVTVALGGGQGNGSIPLAIDWLANVRERAGLVTERGNPTIMVVASIPSRDESNPDVWLNALSGLKKLQEYIDQKQVGSVLVIDNEFVKNYYERDRQVEHNGRPLSALDYSNMILARTLFETLVIPLLGGQVSMDSAELLEILTTPGWLTLNRRNIRGENVNIESELQNLFLRSEVFASIDVKNAIAGGIALISNGTTQIKPSQIDSIKPITNTLLGQPSILHTAVAETQYNRDNSYLLGLAVTPTFPEAILDALMNKHEEELQRKKEREQSGRVMSNRLQNFDDVYSAQRETAAAGGRKKITLDDLEEPVDKPTKKKITLDDL